MLPTFNTAGVVGRGCRNILLERAATVDIDIEFVFDASEEEFGGLVVRRHDGNNAARRKITLNTNIATGGVRLSLQNSRLRVFRRKKAVLN